MDVTVQFLFENHPYPVTVRVVNRLLLGSSEAVERSPRSVAELWSSWRGAKSEFLNPTNYPAKLGAIADRAAAHPHSLSIALTS